MTNLSISHIAWPPEAEEEGLDRLRTLGLGTLEVAPRRAFGDPLAASRAAVEDRAAWYAARGFRIGSFQALLFGAEGVHLFESNEARERMATVLRAVGRVAGWCGAGPMVFGSPRQRLLGALPRAEGWRTARGFFRSLAESCAEAGSVVVMEANPPAYGADFITRLSEAADLVAAVDHPGFRLHLDAGGFALSDEDWEPVVREAMPLVAHVHASQPQLVSFSTPDPVHARLAALLREGGYRGTVAIEMRQQTDVWEAVESAVRTIASLYGPEPASPA